MDVKKIEQLIEVLESSRVEELSVRKGEVCVRIRKGEKVVAPPSRKRSEPAPIQAPAEPQPSSGQFILAPMVGIFHAVDGIAEVGSQVSAGQVVGIIESMKLLNDVVSDVSGKVVEVMVEEGLPVEYGQPLCGIEPLEVSE